MPTLKDDLAHENVIEYARACVEVAQCLSTLHAEGRTFIVLPSRGAYPIYKTADHVREYFNSKYIPHKWMMLPFTADSCQGVASSVARAHWVDVVVAESLGVENASWLFNCKFRRSLGFENSLKPEGFGPFTIIDTVISGRAACEIIDALELSRADYHLILVIDSNGEKIHPEFRRKLNSYATRITEIFVPCLYTEDRGIALMGMTTLLYPDSSAGCHVGSSWIALKPVPIFDWNEDDIPKMENVTHFYSFVHAMHFYATKMVLGRRYGEDEAAVEYFRRCLIANTELVNEESTILFCGKIASAEDIEVTSSMAVRVRAKR